jgi:hypothetical protein
MVRIMVMGSETQYRITSNVRSMFYIFFPVEKLRRVLNSRIVCTFKNWMHFKFEGVL